jgi:hypothetical protein
MKRAIFTSLFAVAAIACFSLTCAADPLDGRDVRKFVQLPMLATPIVSPGTPGPVTEIYRGHDELSTAWGTSTATGATVYEGRFMADDFADRFSTPVVHVKWWGSYLNTLSQTQPVQQFLISFEKDVPVATGGANFSHPGDPILNQIVKRGPLAPGSGTFTEAQVGFSNIDGPTFEYNAELHLGKEFPQDPDTVYWLKIVALYDIPDDLPIELRPRWGWHNRDYTIRNPLASVPLAVTPGEHVQGNLPGPAGTTTPVWHFQDDAVMGNVRVVRTPNMPIMPNVFQNEYLPTRYLFPWDGPPGIELLSKDLAFALFTIPEPSGLALVVMAAAGIMCRRRH